MKRIEPVQCLTLWIKDDGVHQGGVVHERVKVRHGNRAIAGLELAGRVVGNLFEQDVGFFAQCFFDISLTVPIEKPQRRRIGHDDQKKRGDQQAIPDS
jgi:hypothetical protein